LCWIHIINFKFCRLKTEYSHENVKLRHFGKKHGILAKSQHSGLWRKSRFPWFPWLSTVPKHHKCCTILKKKQSHFWTEIHFQIHKSTPCLEKKSLQHFRHNANKFRHHFVFFDTNHPDTSVNKKNKHLAQHCNTPNRILSCCWLNHFIYLAKWIISIVHDKKQNYRYVKIC